jgi:hypothetical protein
MIKPGVFVYFGLMDNRTKISFLLYALVLLGTPGNMDAVPVHDGSESVNSGHDRSSSVYPVGQPKLFCIHRQGNSAINLVRNLPAPNAKNDHQDFKGSGLLRELPIRCAVAAAIHSSRKIVPGLSIRDLLFPFHHFL